MRIIMTVALTATLSQMRAPGSANPYVVGNAAVRRYLEVAEECATARLLRLN